MENKQWMDHENISNHQLASSRPVPVRTNLSYFLQSPLETAG